MRNMDLEKVKAEVATVISEVLEAHPQREGSIFVIGCSSSEICGGVIGKNSSEETGKAVFEAAKALLDQKGLYLACQCCEHLNRALIIEESCAIKYNLEPVCVVPWAHGGGSFATAAWHGFKNPVAVEHIKASAGIDIGSTLIGMHLKDVAVPLHPEQKFIGKAYVTAAWCRPKLIGGERARYQ
ncbi:TIGR01440 family protein [Treponema sp.]|uniref:TIGR01440 family protein n=1 Tax=Treponema sp. TaxID=166 RepID=UPI002600C9A9|nr:TIGR01440 family protein [Treponema sp.]MCR5218706.1 TIGR01440 family protein [Treponema sp.]